MESQPFDSAAVVREVGMPLYQGKGWLKFLGVLSIIEGALAALSIVGIVIAWLPVWMGILLYQSASEIENAQRGGDARALCRAMSKFKLYFTIQGILTLVGLLLCAVGFSMGLLGAIVSFVD